MHRWSRLATAGTVSALLSTGALAIAFNQPSASAAGGQGELALKGTIWVAKAPHRRVTVTTEGDIEVKEGKDIYVRFLDQIDEIFVIEVRWWNVAANINVLEHAVLTRISPNIYRYIEADHHEFGFPTLDFPGIVGRGTFEIQGRNRAKLIQIGHLVDGSASGFTTVLERTDQLPEVPIAQTYP